MQPYLTSLFVLVCLEKERGLLGWGFGERTHVIVEGIRTDFRTLTGLLEDLQVVILGIEIGQPVSPEGRLPYHMFLLEINFKRIFC